MRRSGRVREGAIAEAAEGSGSRHGWPMRPSFAVSEPTRYRGGNGAFHKMVNFQSRSNGWESCHRGGLCL